MSPQAKGRNAFAACLNTMLFTQECTGARADVEVKTVAIRGMTLVTGPPKRMEFCFLF
jgi:hypothetical protein